MIIRNIIILIFAFITLSRPAFGQGDAPPLIRGNGETSYRATVKLNLPHTTLSRAGATATWDTLNMDGGGTSKALTPALGGLVYTDANSMEVLGAGSSGQVLESNGAAAPTWKNPKHSNRLQLLTDGSFEVGVTEGSCSGCTASSESSVAMVSPTNTKSLKMAFSAATGCYTVDKTTGSEFDGSPGYVSAWIKTSASGVTFTARVNGADTTDVATVSSRDGWDHYVIPGVLSSTSYGYKICATASITDEIYVDETYVGSGNLVGQGFSPGKWRTFTPTGSWVSNTTYTGKWRQNGQNAEIQFRASATGAVTATALIFNIPSSIGVIDTTNILASTGTPVSAVPGVAIDTGTSEFSVHAYVESSSSVRVRLMNGSSTNGNVLNNSPFTFGNTDYVEVTVSVPIVGFDAAVNTYTERCTSDVECENMFFAKVSDTGVISAENLDWVNGNGSVSDTSLTAITFNPNIFTVAPNCGVVSTFENAGTVAILPYIRNSTVTSSGFSFRQLRTSDFTKSNQQTTIFCQKTGVDFKARREIIGTFKEMVKTPNVSRPVKFRFNVAETSTQTSVCTSASCTLNGNKGGVATAAARTGEGVYAITLSGLANADYQCGINVRNWETGSDPALCYASTKTSTTLTVSCDTGTTNSDSAFDVNCDGEQ